MQGYITMSQPTPQTQNVAKNMLPFQHRAVVSPEELRFEPITEQVEAMINEKNASVVAQVVRLKDPKGEADISLPILTVPALLMREGRDYVCDSELEVSDVARVHDNLIDLLPKLGSAKIRRIEESTERGTGSAGKTLADFVIYVPGSGYHVRLLFTTVSPAESAESFLYAKDGVDLWQIRLSENKLSFQMNAETVKFQFLRKSSGQSHGLSLMVRDFVGNCLNLVKFLNNSLNSKFHYPGIFDLAGDVRTHYDTKMDRFKAQNQSEVGGVRKYNNLIKTILLSQFVPTRGPVVLDLACGHGQDLQKYRGKQPRLYIGVDISSQALAEAKRRHGQLKKHERYPAEFICGNLNLPETVNQIRSACESHGLVDDHPFDVVSIQLALHYLVGGEAECRGFLGLVANWLKPGGRFIATFPCAERIANRIKLIRPDETGFSFGNELYKVSFARDELGKIIPVGEEEIDKSVESADFGEISEKLNREFGIRYTFYLTDTIDHQEEYVVPLQSLTDAAAGRGMEIEKSGNFSEILHEYSEFKIKSNLTELDEHENEIFIFYRGLVLKKKTEEEIDI
jgi:SAM-dependent methyltransferase